MEKMKNVGEGPIQWPIVIDRSVQQAMASMAIMNSAIDSEVEESNLEIEILQ